MAKPEPEDLKVQMAKAYVSALMKCGIQAMDAMETDLVKKKLTKE